MLSAGIDLDTAVCARRARLGGEVSDRIALWGRAELYAECNVGVCGVQLDPELDRATGFDAAIAFRTESQGDRGRHDLGERPVDAPHCWNPEEALRSRVRRDDS